MNKNIIVIVIIILLVLAGIIYFKSQGYKAGNNPFTSSQTNYNQASPSPAASSDINSDLNDIEKSLNQSDSSLDSSDLNF